ncbi:MAG TPA: stealth family protein [Flavobacterium sp.]|uniref:stealth family protein n=1 Tax=Flavobacterium sp. TaxID=239 RepID=UPI002BB02916|nr:stealth family protein [Flavobacterium sp.]HNP32767.1 stealth family protein [Flavobacterium sp.]
MSDTFKTDFDIDAVITWVDGSDENHAKKLSQYIENKSLMSEKGFVTRFNQANEIEYCIKSIYKFAPYVRTIFIVTDEQTPDFIKNDSKGFYHNVKIVDHKTIFKGYESYLPVFNSNSIETMISRIPDLAERFIYFNDDMLLIGETKPSDFFTTEGIPVLRGRWLNYESAALKEFLKKIGLKKKRVSKLTYKQAQANIAKILGFKRYLKVSHTPIPLRKSVINNYLDQNEEVLINNIKHRFRVPTYFMIQSLGVHLEILNKTFIRKNNFQLVYFGSSDKALWWIKQKLSSAEKDKNKLFLNIQSLDLYPEEKLNYILNWLDKILK